MNKAKAFFIVLAVLILAGIGWYILKNQNKVTTTNSVRYPLNKYNYADYSTTKAVDGFPAELLKDSSKVTESFSATLNGGLQRTVKFESTKDSAVIKQDLLSYLKTNDYSVKEQSNHNIYSVVANNANKNINFSIYSPLADSKITKVTISYAEGK